MTKKGCLGGCLVPTAFVVLIPVMLVLASLSVDIVKDRNKIDRYPLHAAVMENDVIKLEALIESHPEAVNRGIDREARESLFEKFHEIFTNARDNIVEKYSYIGERATPLYVAVQEYKWTAAELLIENGAEMSEAILENILLHNPQRLLEWVEGGLIPADYSAEGSQQSLLTMAVDFSMQNEDRLQLIGFLIEDEAVDIDRRGRRGKTALVQAAEHGNDRVVDILLRAGADAEVFDEQGRGFEEYLAAGEEGETPSEAAQEGEGATGPETSSLGSAAQVDNRYWKIEVDYGRSSETGTEVFTQDFYYDSVDGELSGYVEEMETQSYDLIVAAAFDSTAVQRKYGYEMNGDFTQGETRITRSRQNFRTTYLFTREGAGWNPMEWETVMSAGETVADSGRWRIAEQTTAGPRITRGLVTVDGTSNDVTAGQKAMREVYRLAKDHRQADYVVLEVIFDTENVEDRYGRAIEEDLHLGVIVYGDLIEIRKYEGLGSLDWALREYFAAPFRSYLTPLDMEKIDEVMEHELVGNPFR